MLPGPGILTTILAFALVLGPLVLVHELGHYLVGRWFGVKADAFSVGFGKELAGWTDRRGTRWKLSALPLGGYVQFAGDEDATSRPGDTAGMTTDERAHTLGGRPVWQRALVVLAGPATNLLCAVAIFTCFNVVYGQIVATPVIAGLAKGSPAERAGVRIGDRIVAIDGDPIDSLTQVATHVVPYPGREVSLDIRRDGRSLTVPMRIAEVTEHDDFGNEARIGRIGVAAGKPALVRVGVIEAVPLAVRQTFGVMKMMVGGIAQMFTGERSVRELGGPLTIARMSGQQLSLGWLPFVQFAALISINLAFINLLPIPGLDGGHLAFYAAEAVRRRPLAQRSQEWAFRTGLAFVFALMVFVTINDIVKLPLFGT